MTEKKKPVSERALMARINRVLAKDGEKLRKSRPHEVSNLGTYHTINTYRNELAGFFIDDLEKWARDSDLNVLEANEYLAD